LTKLSLASQYRYKIAQVFPPQDKMTVPLLRLMMAVDDVRRAQLDYLASHLRLGHAPDLEKYLHLGDHLCSLRRLCSHLHEAGRALRNLDTAAARRVDAILDGNAEALGALKDLRTFFNAANYRDSFVARVRNVIGFHYRDADIGALVERHFTEDARGEGVAADVGGLGRMADFLIFSVIDDLAGGDLLTGGEQAEQRIGQAHARAGNLITFVDHLFSLLMTQHPAAVLEHHEFVMPIPEMIWQAKAEVDEDRRQLEAASE
jgi:hypothetical protein